MKRLLFLFIAIIALNSIARAQTTATQTINLTFADVVQILFVTTGSNTGSTVTLPISSVTNYTNGVESEVQDLKVISNKNFNVTVNANATNFTYSGSVTPTPVMPVSGILALNVSANSTGGSIGGSFSGYASLTSSNQTIIANGLRGSNQTFSIKYKGTPGFAYPAGDYTVNIIYTVTQQ